MSPNREIALTQKFKSFIDCLIHLMTATCRDKRTSSIKVFVDVSQHHFNFVCNGIGLSRADMEHINSQNLPEADHLLRTTEITYQQALSRIIANCKKVEILSAIRNRHHAWRVVFDHGIRTRVGLKSSEYSPSTIVIVTGLDNIPRASRDINVYEYFIMKICISALALIHVSIPISVMEKSFGDIIRWPGTYTGLGSAFCALAQCNANTLLPVHATFRDIRMKAFLGLELHSDKYFEYIFINQNFVKWAFLYKLFNQIIRLSFGQNFTMDNLFHKFALFIECPNEYCKVHNGGFISDIRLENLSPIMICFDMLLRNILMLNRCRRSSQNYIYPVKTGFDQTISCQFEKFTVQESDDCHSERYNQLNVSLDYSWKHDFEILIEPLVLKKNFRKLSIMKEAKYLVETSLIIKNRFGSFRKTIPDDNVQMCSSHLFRVISFLLNVWHYKTVRRNEVFNILKQIISPHQSMLADMKARLKSTLRLYKIQDMESLQIMENTDFIDERISLFPSEREHTNRVRFAESSCISISGKGNVEVVGTTSVVHYQQNIAENYLQSFSIAGRNFYAPKGTSPIAAKIKKISLQCASGIKNLTASCDIQKSLGIDKNIGCSKRLKIKSFVGEPESVPKDLFYHIKVIGQLDKKFIVCQFKGQLQPLNKKLVIFDQHGIDERIHLEKYSKKLDDDGESAKKVLENWIKLRFDEQDIALILQYSNYFSRFGIEINSSSTEEGTFSITSIPEILHWLAEHWMKSGGTYEDYLVSSLRDVFEEQISSIKDTGLTTNVIPKILHMQMCKTACSCAIKFGQPLSQYDCCNLIENLSKCTVPFLCAHGRPTAFFMSEVLLDEESPIPPNLETLKKVLNE